MTLDGIEEGKRIEIFNVEAHFGKVALDVFGHINKTTIAAALLREVVS